MNKKISLGVTMSLIAITAAITFILTSRFSLQTYNEKIQDVREMADKYERLDEMDKFVRNNFYNDIDEDELMDAILKGYISGLDDPYAKYYNPEEYKEAIANENGTLVGIGITVEKDESGYIKILEVMDDSPAKDSQIEENDLIIEIDGKDVVELGYIEAIEAIKGDEGTIVKLTIRHNGTDKEYDFQRKSLSLVTAEGEMLKDDIGYIKISKFKTTTPSQFNKILDSHIENGAKALIIDMRNNSGGLVSSAEQCLDPLLPEGDIATATYRDGHTQVICRSDEEQIDIPIVVLVNGKTASAAELFAAALRDFLDVPLVGVNTFGKGIMQTTESLDGGGAVTVTVAKYQTTKSECYHGVGLMPDYEVSLPSDIGVDVKPGAEEDDKQLQKAIEILLD